jgi:DNA polymerase III delta prime subunit
MAIIGFDQITSQLNLFLKEQKLHHANLIFGKRGIGKASFVKDFCLNALTCKNNFHPDLKIICKEEDRKEISVNAIREIADFVNQTSANNNHKFIIIDSACELNKNASNALLKILEEPHNNNYLFLIAHNLNRVIPTLRSRCNLIQAPEFSDLDFKKIIANNHDFSDLELQFLMMISDNSPALAIQHSQDFIRLYQLLLESISKQKISDEIIKKISEKNFSFFIFEKIIAIFYSRFIKSYYQLNQQYFFDEQEIFSYLSLKISIEDAFILAESSIARTNLVSAIYLDKKLFIINILNQLVL